MAQSGVEIESTAPAPPPKFEIIRPEKPGSEPTRTLDNDFPAVFGDPTVRYDPAFIAPFTKETSTGRMGLAGWTSPVGVVTGRWSDEHAAAWLAELRLRDHLGWPAHQGRHAHANVRSPLTALPRRTAPCRS